MLSDTHRRLREATQPDHQRLEDRLGIFTRIATPAGRRALVERFHRLHLDSEAALTPWLADVPGLEFEARLRSPLLARDLTTLGVQAAIPSEPFTVACRAEALGRLYVLEGSSLGGRVIRKQIAAEGGDMVGLSFLDPYGEQVGEQWRAFLSVIDRQIQSTSDLDAAVAGAVAGFREAERRLCPVTVDG